jgi:N-acetylmuramoyl-L-alanine amidase
MPDDQKPAIVIGHKPSSQGASNGTHGETEFKFNTGIARLVAETMDVHVVERPDHRGGYTILPTIINDLNPSVILSLHCNAFDTTVRGCEALYWHRSERGRQLAELIAAQCSALLGNQNRGAKGRTVEDRGGHLLRNTAAACVIAEPFFIDNDEDYESGRDNAEALAAVYRDVLNEFLGQ